jgi:hypothetical protein
MVYQSLVIAQVDWNDFLRELSIITGALGALLSAASLGYFVYKENITTYKASEFHLKLKSSNF